MIRASPHSLILSAALLPWMIPGTSTQTGHCMCLSLCNCYVCDPITEQAISSDSVPLWSIFKCIWMWGDLLSFCD